MPCALLKSKQPLYPCILCFSKLNMEGFFMSKKGIKVASVTHAMKGRDLLQKNGYKAYLTRNPNPSEDDGCGYVIYVNNMDGKCFAVLKNGGIKIKGTVDLGDVL